MTNHELLSSIQSLDANEQFELANKVLDSLAEAGRWPLTEDMKRMLDERAKRSDSNPDRLIPAEQVFAELRMNQKTN